MSPVKYKRILLKLSGEALGGEGGSTVEASTVSRIASQIKSAREQDVEIAVVVGGGNIWRGAEAEKAGMDRAVADYAGMLATIINAIALQDALERMGVMTRTMSALNIPEVAEPYIRRRAVRHLEKGRVVIFAGGTGNPYMTTDTAAALRAIEIEAQILLMAKNNVDGIYEADPATHPDARKFETLTYMEALNKRLAVMDATALSLCLENKLQLIVFDMKPADSLVRAVSGEPIGTLVSCN